MDKGPFDTETRTTIKTEYGTVLKITQYEYGCLPETEYKIRQNCVICKDPGPCLCFSEHNDFTFADAINAIKHGVICEEPSCVIEYEKQNNSEYFKVLEAKHQIQDIYIQGISFCPWCGQRID